MSTIKRTLRGGVSTLTITFAAMTALTGAGTSSAAAGSFFENIGKAVETAVQDTGKTIEKGVHDTGKAVEKGTQDTGKAIEKGAQDTGKAVEKGAHDTGKTLEKATQDTGKAVEKAGQDTVDAGRAIGKFVERQVNGIGHSLSDAEVRLREGKVVDAIWHLSTDQLKNTEQNAAEAAKESNILRTVGQVAATAYGGPGGAAAYAAWYAYRETGDAELAFRVGLITGATSAGFNAAGKLPSGTDWELTKKTIVTGTVGGLAVAAAGGDEAAMRDAFLLAGGMVLVQDGYRSVTKHKLDPRASKGEAYCMATVGEKCSPELSAYIRDADGKILYDEKGNPRVDVTKVDPRRPRVGTWAKANETPLIGVGERSALMTGVSRVPGMNAMALFHDQWSVTWHMDTFTNVVTIAPAVVLTYTGTGAPFFEKLEGTVVEAAQPTN
jgi:hypothetical protein